VTVSLSKESPFVYEFGTFRLDPAERLLSRAGQPVQLAPKVFDTLLALVENGGRLIDKEQLISRLWPDTFVEEATLARNISDLRKVLGESTGEQKFIETVPKRGYRFIAAVHCTQLESLPKPPFPNSDPEQSTVIVERHFRSQTIFEEQLDADVVVSIAILPFRPITSEGRDEYLELGIADALITRLSNVSQIVVRPTSAVRKYIGVEQESADAGRELKVGHVLDGSIQRDGDRIRVTAQLVSVDDGRSLWAGKFDEEFTDIFSVEDAISDQVANALVLKLTGEERRLIARRDTDDAEAHRLYLKGRYYWNKRTRNGYETGIEYFNQAIGIDGSYALAFSGLADCYSMLGRFGMVQPAEVMPKAVAAADTSLRLDDSLAESHASAALAAHIHSWDWTEAEEHYRRAIRLNPHFATGHHWYGVFLAEMGRGEESIAQITIAQNLDPVSLIIGADAGMILYLMRDYDRALRQCLATLDMDPNYFRARMWLGCAYEQKGLYEQALAEYQTARSLDETPYVLEWLARAHALSGNPVQANRLIAELSALSSDVYVDSYYLASVYAALGNEQKAIVQLEKACRERSCWLSRLRVDPIFDALRQLPEFEAVLISAGLHA
jgi:DNA-binding winged helix-turn-helix (wHTH) protein/tetratricopeptide (TPR) repeat protein